MLNNDIDILLHFFTKLPNFGKRSARRTVLHLINNKENLMLPLAKAIENTANSVKICQECYNFDSFSPCNICSNEKRDRTTICVVEEVADLWAIERSNMFKGIYHVLGGVLSAVDGKGPNELNIESLVKKAGNYLVKEIILATNATVEGQTTAHYITTRLQDFSVIVTRIAYGMPIGGEIDYLDEGTLSAAFNSRRPL